MTAGLQKIFHPDPAIGFLSHANRFSDALAGGQVLAPAQNPAQRSQIIWNDRIDAALLVLVVVSILYYGIRSCLEAYRADRWTAQEASATSLEDGAAAAVSGMR
jgi:carbon starvation protein